MITLRQAVYEYLRMRRRLGFKLHEPEKGLLDFGRFLERQRAPVLIQLLALTSRSGLLERQNVTQDESKLADPRTLRRKRRRRTAAK